MEGRITGDLTTCRSGNKRDPTRLTLDKQQYESGNNPCQFVPEVGELRTVGISIKNLSIGINRVNVGGIFFEAISPTQVNAAFGPKLDRGP